MAVQHVPFVALVGGFGGVLIAVFWNIDPLIGAILGTLGGAALAWMVD